MRSTKFYKKKCTKFCIILFSQRMGTAWTLINDSLFAMLNGTYIGMHRIVTRRPNSAESIVDKKWKCSAHRKCAIIFIHRYKKLTLCTIFIRLFEVMTSNCVRVCVCVIFSFSVCFWFHLGVWGECEADWLKWVFLCRHRRAARVCERMAEGVGDMRIGRRARSWALHDAQAHKP
jgi:hypothetical protein